MHYHCINNPKYIHELKKELEKIGIYDSNKREIEIKVKEEFKSSKFFQNAVLYVNKKAKSDRKHITTVFDANVKKEYIHIIKT
jgi:type III restriction enzyme